jgi:hypothetical protein
MEGLGTVGFVFGLIGISFGIIAHTAVKKLIKELKGKDLLGENYKM